ncbi:ferritin-like domain-containing protein [Pyxidicoccus sp. MSG2]|uniref:ferritin-like domain-containing protein n=1 Tax=Pyxidicoccus sp. MSG2 TaxID=2996790 RepID=UPI00226EC12C|nr:ferritin-like domain-containing protein [Pyxidicoccus sp. MSG2]MCY1022514.1 ferritin-like domain-containing protein [Pyxidicoccus sp. MSG2]
METSRAAPLEKVTAKTWDGLSRLAFATDWNPETAIDWSRPIELGAIKEGWINILQYFYEGEWQGLEIIQRLMNKAAHLFDTSEMVTYYSTQCYDESKHLFVFRTYLHKLNAPPARLKAFDLLVFLATTGPMPVERWILATYFTETLAATIFQRSLELDTVDTTGKEMIRLMLKDESRHIAGTRLGVQTLMAHSGPVKTALLKLWWRLFIRLAVREVRKLQRHGDQVGMDSEAILQRTFARMAGMEAFDSQFLSGDFARGFLHDSAA